MAEAPFPDNVVLSEVNAGTWQVANTHIAFRQMKALESIAASLAKLSLPPLVFSNQETGQLATLQGGLGNYGFQQGQPSTTVFVPGLGVIQEPQSVYVTGQQNAVADAAMAAAQTAQIRQDAVAFGKKLNREQVALRPDADTDLDEPPLDAA